MPTVAELRSLARSNKLKGYSSATKPKLIELLVKAGVAVPEEAQKKSPPVVKVSTQRFVKLGEVEANGGELILVSDSELDESKYDDLEKLTKAGQALSLGTGGDGSFSVYGVYVDGQEDNLPREYRIVIAEDSYKDRAITSAENERFLEAGYKKNGTND